MRIINAISLAPDVLNWLAYSQHPRILHVFDHACNLINERKEVLSIVTSQIGNGPFNLVIEDDVLFSDYLRAQSSISIHSNQLHVGALDICTTSVQLWNPRPDWERLHGRRDDVFNQIIKLSPINYQKWGLDMPFAKTAQDYAATTSLSTALTKADIPTALIRTRQLAGLGQGLTPAGDDFIVGAVLAAWIIHPPEVARVLAEQITNTAAPLTTSLSAAWLKSAGRGEAGILWHNFFDALSSADPKQIQDTANHILAIGETSGADALTGFIATFSSYTELRENDVLLK